MINDCRHEESDVLYQECTQLLHLANGGLARIITLVVHTISTINNT